MSLSTHFQHTEITQLPLPPVKSGQTVEDVIEQGMKVAVSLLHNHDYMMDLNPLQLRHEPIPASSDQAVDVEKLAKEFNVPLEGEDDEHGRPQRINGGDEWRHYEIHEQVPVAFGYKKVITFQSALRNMPNAMESLTDPGNTVSVHGKYCITRTQGDTSTLTLTERSTTHCNVILGWYIKSTLGTSHASIHQAIKARFVEEMQKAA